MKPVTAKEETDVSEPKQMQGLNDHKHNFLFLLLSLVSHLKLNRGRGKDIVMTELLFFKGKRMGRET